MKRLILPLCFLLFACAHPAGYEKFSMTKPLPSPTMSYQDENITVQFTVRKAFMCGLDGLKQYWLYDALDFNLQNKTEEVMTIDWNKISFIDYTGMSGNAVMHKNIKYNECSNAKSPSVVPPNGRISDVIVPCSAVQWENNKWKVSMLPSPRQMPNVTFGVFMPLQFGSETKNYTFMFEASALQQ